MNNEERLLKKIEEYKELAKQDKNIDLATLMAHALQSNQGNTLTLGEKKKAYWVAVLLPPFGLIYAAKFFMSPKEDAEHAAWISLVLTAVAVLLYVIFSKVVFSSISLTVPQNLQW